MSNEAPKKYSDQEINDMATTIMQRIHTKDNKIAKLKKYKPTLIVAAAILIFMLPLFAFQDSSPSITKISANEYKLTLYKNDILFKLHAFVENDEQVYFNEDLNYYKDFTKYYDITADLNVELIEIEDYLFLEIRQIDKRYDYLYINTSNKTSPYVEHMNDKYFFDFEREMTEIINNVKKYPYQVETNEYGCKSYSAHPNTSELEKQDKKNYLWFKNYYESTCMPQQEDMKTYEHLLIFDGTKEDIGKIEFSERIGGTPTKSEYLMSIEKYLFPVSYKNYWTFYRPDTYKVEETNDLIKVETFKEFFFETLDREEVNLVGLGAKIQFPIYKPEELDIQMFVNNEPVPTENYVYNGNSLLIMPVITEQTITEDTMLIENGEYNPILISGGIINIKIYNKKTGAELINYTDDETIFSFAPEAFK